MYKIVKKRALNDTVTLMQILAPDVARAAEPGQFIIFRVNETGERVPLTINDYDKTAGTVTIVFQKVGKSTMLLDSLNEGDCILDFAGPLGTPTELEGFSRVAVIGGGLGTAICLPQAKKLKELGAHVDIIAGFRTKELVILEDEMKHVSDNLYVMTDDGSNGNRGFVTECLEKLIQSGQKYDLIIAIGPLVMMRAVSNLTKKYGIKTIVSMNSIMIDGTGMCGGCRIMVGGKMKFACVVGPDFDGHEVDFDSAIRRQSVYKKSEEASMREHNCRLMGGTENA